MRTFPSVSGRKPDGWTSPVCEMNMIPLPSRRPRPDRRVGPTRGSDGPPLSRGPLEGHAPVVGGLGRRDDERGLLRPPPEPSKKGFARAGRQLVERPAAADLDEEEEAPSCGSRPVNQVRDGREVGEGLGRRERVYLERDAFLDGRSDGRHRPGETARYTAESVVPNGVGAVQAERHGFNARAPERGGRPRW